MSIFPVSVVLWLLISARELQVLAGPVGAASPCHKGTYYNSATRGCEPCSQLCDDVRDSQDDCREKCADWFDRNSETDPYFILALAAAGSGWLVAFILTVILVMTRRKLTKYEKEDQDQERKKEHDEPKKRCSLKVLTLDLHQMEEMPPGRPSSPVQVTDNTPFSPSNMRSIHADETTKPHSTEPAI